VELVKNDKYMFFELPFIKGNPDVSLYIAPAPKLRTLIAPAY
jgi:hypothetical protein